MVSLYNAGMGFENTFLNFKVFVAQDPAKHILSICVFLKLNEISPNLFKCVLIFRMIRSTKGMMFSCKHNLRKFGTKWNIKDRYLSQWLLSIWVSWHHVLDWRKCTFKMVLRSSWSQDKEKRLCTLARGRTFFVNSGPKCKYFAPQMRLHSYRFLCVTHDALVEVWVYITSDEFINEI